MKNEQEIKDFWNNAFGVNEPQAFTKEDAKPQNCFDEYIKEYSLKAKRILDYGCGITTDLIIASYTNDKLVEALGIDPSKNAIDFMEKSRKLSKINNISFEVGDYKTLRDYKEGYFDFIICSNVLDCVTNDITKFSAIELARLLKKGGTMLFKVNFYLSPEDAVKHGLVSMGNGEYSSNGLFRIAFYEDDYWINLFKGLGLKLVKQDGLQRNPTGPKDRIFIFTK